MEVTLGASDAAKVHFEEDEPRRQYARKDEYEGVQIEELPGCHSQHTRGKSRLCEAIKTIAADVVDVGPRVTRISG